MDKSLLNEVKAILKSLVLSCPDKITIEQLNRDYRDVEGQFIPYRQMGYGNLEQFLRSIPDTLRVFGSGPTAMVCFVANEKSDHIHDMIIKQKKPRSRGARSRSKGISLSRNSGGGTQRGNKVNTNTQTHNGKRGGHQLSPFQSVNRNQSTKTVQVRNVPQVVKPNTYNQALLPNPQLYALPQPHGIVFNLPSQNPQQAINYNNAVNNMRNIIINAQKYEENARQISNLLKSQCNVSSPPPPLPRQQTRNVQFAPVTNLSHQSKIENKTTRHLPMKLSEEIENLLAMPKLTKATNPIKDSSLNKDIENQQEEGEMPPLVKKSNFQTETIIESDKTKVMKAKKETEIIKANKKETNSPRKFFDDSTDKVEDPDEAVPSFAAKNNVFRLDFPEHTVPYGHKIAPFKLSDDVKQGSCLKIFISEIHNPFKFWFHIHKDNHELDLLMYQIERYYSPLDKDDLRIPLTCLIPGQVCAASYNGLWHRAEIVAPPVNNTIKVSFMDYGTVSEVNIENIKFLASLFAQLPAQALRGCLSHIKPRGLHWSHQATTLFLTLVAELMLYAKIAEIDREENILYMILCNTNGDEVVQINKTLVDSHYAFYNEEWKTQKIQQNNGKRVHHPREDFPTFAMIEAGEYPSFIELVNLQQRGIDYETIYDLIIYNQSTILNKHENAPERIRNLPYFLTTSNPFRSDILLELYATTSKAI